ncbi:MAG: rod shape-determining protein MreC [Deltaproteobacteria bacterium]|nr:rod shape-determining protein MreC [Deltaproteobacteria bacterium]
MFSRRLPSISANSRYRFRILLYALVLPLFLYISIYTWNWRTGSLDRFSAYTGMELVGWTLAPGQYVHRLLSGVWTKYVDLVHVREALDALRMERNRLMEELAQAREEVAEAERLRRILNFSPPSGWKREGVRVVGQRMGPNALLETIMLDKGSMQGVKPDSPVIAPDGVIGRVYRVGLNYSTVLLLSDPNSRIPVLSQSSRTPGILYGQGEGFPLTLRYVPVNSPMSEGEVLVTSGMAGIFPKGLPVARVSRIEGSETSLFLEIEAISPLSAILAEELLVMTPSEGLANENGHENVLKFEEE